MKRAPIIQCLILMAGLSQLSACAFSRAFEHSALPAGARQIDDLCYYSGPGADPEKHQLDLYLPPGPGPHPVIVFVYGGAWKRGDRKDYGNLGRRLAARGILTAAISYRLAPRHPHPAQVRDSARALAWVYANIKKYQGNPKKIFLMGHSAGAHLVALLACDPRWLAEQKLDPKIIAGVIAISGPYDITFMARDVPKLAKEVFSEHPENWKKASPANHLGKSPLPPFLIAHADKEHPSLHQQAKMFSIALRQAGASVKNYEAKNSNHFRIIQNLARPGDTLGTLLENFISSESFP